MKGTRTCPHSIEHKEDNFIIEHDEKKGEISYICLSEECPSRRSHMAFINGLKLMEDGQTFEDLGVKTDLEAAEKMMKLHEHWVCCDDNLYVFNNTTGLWSCENGLHMKIISSFDEQLRLLTFSEKTHEWKRNAKGYGNDTILMKKMLPFIKCMCVDSDWMKKTSRTSLGKFLFKNGFIDMRTNSFSFSFNPKIVFLARIPFDYEPVQYSDRQYMEDLKNRYFTLPLGEEVGDFFLLNLSRGLA